MSLSQYKTMFVCQDENGDTALMLLCANHSELVKYLINSPFCSPELLARRNKAGDTALMIACRGPEGSDAVKCILGSQHYSPELLLQKNNNGDTVLLTACAYQPKDILEIIIQACQSNEKSI